MGLLDKTYKMPDDIVARKNPNGSVVLMRMDDSEVFYKIEGVAADLWKGIECGKSANEVITELLEEYDCSREQIETDANAFINELLQKKMLD